MAFFDRVQQPEGNKRPGSTGGFFGEVYKQNPGLEANAAINIYKSQLTRGVQRDLSRFRREAMAQIDKDKDFSPIEGFKEGMRDVWSHREKDKSFARFFGIGEEYSPSRDGTLAGMVDGSSAMQVWSREWAKVVQDSANTIRSQNSDTFQDLMISGMEDAHAIVNVAFAPVTSTLKAASSFPILGYLADGIEAIFGGVAGAAGELDAVIYNTPDWMISPERKQEWGGIVRDTSALAAMIGTGKLTHIAAVKTQPKIRALNDRIADTLENTARDKFLREQGLLEKEPAVTRTEYTPDADLPTINWEGRAPRGFRQRPPNQLVPESELPTVSPTTGKVRPPRRRTKPVAEPTTTPVYENVKAERGIYQGKTVVVTEKSGPDQPGTVISTTKKSATVRLEDGTEITVRNSRIRDPRSEAEIVEAAAKREAWKAENKPIVADKTIKAETPPPPKKTAKGKPIAESTAEVTKGKKEQPKVKEEPFLSDTYNNMLIEMDLAEAGQRKANTYLNADGTTQKITSRRSTFPDWIPEGIRTKKNVNRYLADKTGRPSDLDVTYKKGSVMDRMHQAFLKEWKRREQEAELSRVQESTINGRPVTDEALAAEMAGEGYSPRLPVSGPGEAAIPKASARILKENLEWEFGEIPGYTRQNWTHQANEALKFIERDREAAWRVAMGIERPPAGLLAAAVWKEFRLRARAKGDVAMAERLANSRVPQEITRGSQEAGVLAGLGKNDATGLYVEFNKSQKELWDKRNKKPGEKAEDAIARDLDAIERYIVESVSDKAAYKELAKRLLCK